LLGYKGGSSEPPRTPLATGLVDHCKNIRIDLTTLVASVVIQGNGVPGDTLEVNEELLEIMPIITVSAYLERTLKEHIFPCTSSGIP